MNRSFLLIAVLGTLSLSPILASPQSGIPPTGKVAPSGQVAVLVELFTSEGCSSCPPVDAVLTDLEQTQPVAGVQIIALGEHVNYWDTSRWTDRFSSAALTARQYDYAASFHNAQVYTPQIVVDGWAEFVGSDRAAALSTIARNARLPKAAVQIAASGRRVTVMVSHLPAGARAAQVWLAVTEDGLQSQVRGGENAGQHLTHSAVVREMRLLGTAHVGAQFTASVPTGNSKSVVAFVQETGSRRVLGAALVKL